MFQDFSDLACPDQGRVRIPLLREELQEQGLTGFIVPRADEYSGENLAAYAERLGWLTGFTGSAGAAVILKTSAAIFIDGRYTLQVRDQVDTDLLTPVSIPKQSVSGWLKENTRAGEVIGFDPWLHSASDAKRLLAACEATGTELRPCSVNPIDAIWSDQPDRPTGDVILHPLSLAGQSAEDKLAKIVDSLQGKATATFITQGDSIAWLFNIRGNDVPCAPLPLAFAIVTADGRAFLIIDPAKISTDVKATLPSNVEIVAPSGLAPTIQKLAGNDVTWMLDEALVPYAVKQMIEATGSAVIAGSDPCLKPKAAKNKAELDGMRAAHRRDGAAM